MMVIGFCGDFIDDVWATLMNSPIFGIHCCFAVYIYIYILIYTTKIYRKGKMNMLKNDVRIIFGTKKLRTSPKK